MGEDEGSVPLIRFTNLFCSNTEVQVDVMLSGGECIFNIRPRFLLLEMCQPLCLSSASPEEADNDVSVSISTQPCAIQGLLQITEEEMDLLHLRENLRRN